MPKIDSQTRPRKERKENAERRRRQLLDATRRSIVVNGLRRTTLATVANEAGLSPGVAVFYFKSKPGLLAEALRDLYISYERNWNRLLEEAGEDPIERLIALIRAEFDPEVCNEEFISVWFAFWGEKEIVLSQGTEISAFDLRIEQTGKDILDQLLPTEPERSKEISSWLEMLLGGMWLALHMDPRTINLEDTKKSVLRFLAMQLPEYSSAILRHA